MLLLGDRDMAARRRPANGSRDWDEDGDAAAADGEGTGSSGERADGGSLPIVPFEGSGIFILSVSMERGLGRRVLRVAAAGDKVSVLPWTMGTGDTDTAAFASISAIWATVIDGAATPFNVVRRDTGGEGGKDGVGLLRSVAEQ